MTDFNYSPDDLLWISREHKLPDACCSCGMFTDHRVKVKHVAYKTVMSSSDSTGITLLKLVALFLGPLGWALSAMLSKEGETEKTVKQKSKIVLPQCQLCYGMASPSVMEMTDEDPVRFGVIVHSSFRKKFEQANMDARF